jgi:hypothetical protein
MPELTEGQLTIIEQRPRAVYEGEGFSLVLLDRAVEFGPLCSGLRQAWTERERLSGELLKAHKELVLRTGLLDKALNTIKWYQQQYGIPAASIPADFITVTEEATKDFITVTEEATNA